MTGKARTPASEVGLSAEEYAGIKDHLGREPNQLELYLFSVMWSEHCGYKNSRPLLKQLPSKGPSVLQGPGENAGVVRIGDGWAVVFKIESHNHPSAVEPFQGAATGVGGILRDIFAMGARPLAVLNSLRFGDPKSPRTRHLLRGVVEGIGHYGNAIGVPTVGGELSFHPGYQDNPLVNVMCVGLVREEALKRSRAPHGHPVYYLGARTGRDGIGGASFASEELADDNEAKRPNVQVGDPFMGKLLMETTLDAIRLDLVEGVQDMGAAGLTSSLVELAANSGLGLELELSLVPRREEGMNPVEVMLSESQERMVLVPRASRETELEDLARHYGLEAVAIGRIIEDPLFRVLEHGQVKAELPVSALAQAPTYLHAAQEDPLVKAAREKTLEDLPADPDLHAALLVLLAHPELASKHPIFERYDQQVGTNTVFLPEQADAALLRVKGTVKGLALSTDANARFCHLAPRLGAMHALAEATRNVSVLGATPLAYTNGLNMANPEDPAGYFELSESIAGLMEASTQLSLPVVSGNVSLYNQGPNYRVPPTPIVGVVGLLEQLKQRAELGFARTGELLVLLGGNTAELGASAYLWIRHGREEGAVPALDLAREKAVQQAIRDLVRTGLVHTAHDLSSGGLLAALAEMTFPYQLGVTLELRGPLPPQALLFGEAPSRILFTVDKTSLGEATDLLDARNLPYQVLGEVGGTNLSVLLQNQKLVWPVAELKAAWAKPLEQLMQDEARA